jgi:hypothetical protein
MVLYYLTLLVIYECLNIMKNNLALVAILSIRHCQKRTGHTSELGSSLGFFLL